MSFPRSEEIQRAIEDALEISVYLSPDDPGLTLRQLQEVCGPLGFRPGEVADRLERLSGDVVDVSRTGRHRLTQRSYRWQPWVWWSEDHLQLIEVGALDFVQTHLRDLAREKGARHAQVARGHLVEVGVHDGHDRKALALALALLELQGTISIREGRVVMKPGMEQRPLIGELLEQNARAGSPLERPREPFQGLIPIVRQVLLARESDEAAKRPKTGEQMNPSERYVFVVHGRNYAARDAIFDLLRAVDLKPLEWNQIHKMAGKPNAYIGDVLKVGFEMAAACVVVLSGDDEARLRDKFRSQDDSVDEGQLQPQSRPNVLFEAGMAFGLNANRTLFVQFGKHRAFSDIGGMHLLEMADTPSARKELCERLRNAGCPVDTTGDAWLTAGDFSAALTAAEAP